MKLAIIHNAENISYVKSRNYILLIDDDEDDLEMYSTELKRKGIQVKSFHSSTKALLY
jgi:DNA-binding NtrC family response regulator